MGIGLLHKTLKICVKSLEPSLANLGWPLSSIGNHTVSLMRTMPIFLARCPGNSALSV
jgi:hypothetical protein